MSKHKSLKSGSTKHQVHLCEGVNGTGEKLFAYSFLSLAELFGVKEVTIRQWVHLGKFDPLDLQSVADFYTARAATPEPKPTLKCLCGHAEWCSVCTSY